MFFSRRTVAVVFAAAATLVKAQSESGQGTWFEVGLGACGVYNVDTDHIVAISEALFDSYPATSPGNPNTNTVCNRAISITYNGITAQALVTDRCAGCAGWGDVDMSPSLFSVFADQGVGRLYGVNWNFI
ncbi:hypothetical protein FIBSPDRAFT_941326 [Athelia psychrophila]|uniref:Plant expansin n=1 Tax=Athelia psychrophila TaxID=1759441 RepID=A0A167UCS4_9AGAM|nr:hypothetical protein FIBSPDRAFT_941326 [Fibularhizoctonia sp. CBS 109695]